MSKVQIRPKGKSRAIRSNVINIRLGVFFDGTGNNKLNIRDFQNNKAPWYSWSTVKMKLSASYKSGFSNIAILSYYYNSKPRAGEYYNFVYIEGIATAPRKKNTDSGGSDSLLAAASGMGRYGVNGKVQRGCELVTSKICDIIKGKGNTIIGNLKLDVFGFSRGAAAARRFISCIEKPYGDTMEGFGKLVIRYNVCLRNQLKKSGVKVNKITPCFLGLFDTVSSYGLNFENDVKELTLGVSHPEKVVQLVAGDEYRKNFALTRINSANKAGEEIILPGAHSDIGGGYCSSEKEDVKLAVHRGIVYRGYKTLNQLLEEGWLLKGNEVTRTVSNKYSYIPLHIMYGYKKEVFSSRLLNRYMILPALRPIMNRLSSVRTKPLYRFSKPPSVAITPLFSKGSKDYVLVKSIRHSYLHLSAKGGIADSPAKNNRRIIIDDNEKKS